MRNFRAILTISLVAACLYSCDKETITEPTSELVPADTIPLDTNTTDTTESVPDRILYVSAGSSGDGSESDPLGSIQEALDILSMGSGKFSVFVANGEYFGSLTISAGITISGGRDPQADWAITSQRGSIIRGGELSGFAIGAMIKDVIAPVLLDRLTIIGANATDSGEGSYGLYCLNSDSVVVSNCEISSGNGMAGANGNVGEDGGVSSVALGGQGGSGCWDNGYYDEECLRQGYTDCYIHGNLNGSPGDTGLGSDGAKTGGAGGASGYPGEDGTPSTQDRDSGGIGGINSLSIAFDNGFTIVQGVVGDSGLDATESGSGGGGGGGAGCGCYSVIGPNCPGGPGGSGGAGGAPGKGGEGGFPGGSSVSIIVLNSLLHLENTDLITKSGGQGGDGGVGGVGGTGELGQDAYWEGIGSAGGDGGAGGNGQAGGHGGGGSGGATICVVFKNSTIEASFVNYDLGFPGQGGASEGFAGSLGKIAEVYQFPN
ncbi:MAG: hypothetical protein IIB00_00375 [candidate division Zixibacteria bacterium]|nr:hypothetical protein [candidate division Zixibacteria bacterium]